MKVAQFPDYRKDNPYQQLLADALDELGVEVVFTRGYRRALPFSRALAAEPEISVLHLHWLTPYLRGESYLAKMIYAIKLLLDLWLVKARGVKLAWTVHNMVTHETKTPKLEVWLSRKLAALTDSLIVHSKGAKDAVVEQFKVRPSKIAIIPHGDFGDAYGEKVPQAQARKQLGLDPQVPVFLFFGMIRPYKGVQQLLQAWRENPPLHQNAALVIAGDARDPEMAESVSAAASGNPNVYLCMQFIPDDDVPVFFGAADCMVLPFTQSLTSGSLALAKTYSLPVVAALTEGTTTAGSKVASYHYEANDARGLASAMKAMLQDLSSGRSAPGEALLDGERGWTSIARLHHDVYHAGLPLGS